MENANFLLFPPVAFALFLLIGALLYLFGALLAEKGGLNGGKKHQYACGEDVPAAKVQPDYSFFFPFAIFFTIIHVTALIMATLPIGNIALMGILYLAGISISLYTLVVR
jgi:NADH:ubiquinone oxidoreductase subunit 3 (subunit A)